MQEINHKGPQSYTYTPGFSQKMLQSSDCMYSLISIKENVIK